MIRPTYFLLASLLIPTTTFAFFCPTNFNQIDYGNTPDQVFLKCGKPDSQIESVKQNDNVPQEWNYFIQQTVATNTTYQAQGTLKTSMTFDSNGKAINISVNGIGVGGTLICGTNIKLGDSKDAVKSACGQPAFINKQVNPASPAGQQPPTETKVLEFDYDQAKPPAKLIFENGILTSKQ